MAAVQWGGFVPIQPAFFGYMALLRGVLLVMTRRWRTVDLIPVAVAGSKITPWDFAKSLCSLAWIYWQYLRPRAPPCRVPGHPSTSPAVHRVTVSDCSTDGLVVSPGP